MLWNRSWNGLSIRFSVISFIKSFPPLQTIPLDWWPLTRDSIAYGFTVAVLICVMHDERVEWYEALILVSLYAVYLAVMYFDKTFQKCAKGRCSHCDCFTRVSLSDQCFSYN